jgi:hypothetical protein
MSCAILASPGVSLFLSAGASAGACGVAAAFGHQLVFELGDRAAER